MPQKKVVAIVQSNYIPWKGYFDLISRVDEFILLDDVQYTRRDWRNRNLIKTPNGLKWLTIPVNVKGKYLQKINETTISDEEWGQNHWNAIHQNYREAPFFNHYSDKLEAFYTNNSEQYLSKINHSLIQMIIDWLKIETKISWSSDYKLVEGKTERLVELCLASNATEYLSGPAARNYLDESAFNQHDIGVSWMYYDDYPIYDQLYPPFEHGVSILDLIFNMGPESNNYMKFN